MIRLSMLLVALLLASPAEARPRFEPMIGTQLEVGLEFTDAAGSTKPLSDHLDGKPALLLLGYNECPNLCGLTQNAVAHSLLETGLDANTYSALFVSIDAAETAAHARKSRARLAEATSVEGIEPWRLLVSAEGAGTALARQAGMEIEERPRIEQFVHPLAIMSLTPDGRIARVLPATTFEARDLRLALVEASSGVIGSIADQIFLLCAGFDSTKGQYTSLIWAAVQAGGVTTALILGGGIAGLALHRHRNSGRSE